ncbi:phosphomannomutase [Streptoalloteichus tenebrarius]|uniref:Phosphomannomutase n=1 Tax=Streptoalloteichus tenebrarius (strain ATCC 17920 / DSM 40477 / JCM 4838 / CBS 697.72 / NBRC 16177 / NCIMB 11028 / NRRL B-12390 / A12253. 1 / ISP 5477) TaxID=1933 RepID=A0ABT1HY71_STRSD|nr:phospho-sugar mutase [Streptoalloteichus tenebrarius]MCP2260466.1 phosphomannomutase [Streptoalloteichus tenebrarius]BFF02738.1 phospho-sugar mutase [Streptoalloteichus tenebrarius]
MSPAGGVDPALRDAAFRWIADDVDPAARAELQRVLASALAGDAAAADDLADRMAGPLRFGTAGLRGPLRAGQNGMNRAVVVRATAGLAEWLRAHGRAGGVVVVGRDARHGSEEFHADVAGVLAAAGFDVRVLPRPLPTPVLAFAVRRLDAVAGVQVTASHNPPGDNGYKVYLDAGAQIVPPVDAEIEAAIAASPASVAVPRSTDWSTVDESLVEEYVAGVAALPTGTARDLRVALTPLHGVGGETGVLALRAAGFTDVHVTASQAAPDPDFPTVSFPNPEEPGATDALLALASEVGADLAVALDPDADRCALGVRDRDGRWRMLRGDETGVLLGDRVLSTLDRSAHPDPLVATTIVSSSMLRSVAEAHGARYDETLTGFKWLVRAGDGRGTGLVYAYEEALGHCVAPDLVRDKDGISAAVLACDLAAELKAAGRTLVDALDELAVRHGLHLTDQVSVRLGAMAEVQSAMAALRERVPAEVGGRPVTAEDLRPRDNTLALRGEGLRIMIRPSGTEPKLKAYLEIVERAESTAELDAARERGRAALLALRGDVEALLLG